MRWRLALGAAPALLPALALAQRSPFGPRPGAAAPPPASGIIAKLLQLQAEFHLALTKAIAGLEQPSAMLTLLGLAFAYGVIHAIGPGHGKAVIAAYLVSSERAAKRGIALALAAALVQALIALGIVGVVALLLGGTARQMEDSAHFIGQAGYALIAAMGLAIAWRKARALSNTLAATADSDCGAACGHDHGPAPESASVGRLALIAIGAGIRPCSGAVILLVFALTKGAYAAGAAATAAMALGTALGTSAFALLALKAKALSLRLISGRDRSIAAVMLGAELLAGLLLAALGVLLFIGAIASPS